MLNDTRPTSVILIERNSICGVLQLDPVTDLPTHHDADGDSFWMASYLSDGKEQFTVVVHIMFLFRSPIGAAGQVAISVFNDSNGDYSSRAASCFLDKTDFKLSNTTAAVREGASHTQLDVSMTANGLPREVAAALGAPPTVDQVTCRLTGTIDGLRVEVSSAGGGPSLKVELKALGPIFPYLVTGVIPFGGGINYEYALPHMETSGTVFFEGENHKVKGWTWLDREWGRFGPSKWTWMDIQLSNGVQMSVWDQHDKNDNPKSYVAGERAFVNFLYPDESLGVDRVNVEEHSWWDSPRSKETYATEWTVTVPGKRIDLHLKLLRNDQEIMDPQVAMPRIEGKCRVTGTFDGNPVTGDAMVEMFNLFPLFFRAYSGIRLGNGAT